MKKNKKKTKRKQKENKEKEIKKACESLDLEAENICLLNAETNKVVFERANDEKLSPASTTKIVTAMVDRKYCSLDEMVMVGEELDYVAPDASGAYLCKGDCLSIEDLL